MAKLEDVIKAHGGGKQSGKFAVPLSMLQIDTQLDKRDRTTERYQIHFNNVKAGIVTRKGIEDTIEVHRGVGDNADTLYVVNGRTRTYAAREAISEGLLGDVTEDTFLVPVEVKQGNELDFLATQFRTQQVLTLSAAEQGAIVAEMVRTAGGLEDKVAEALGKSLKQVQDLLKVDRLLPQVKEMISNGDVAVTVAVELAEEHSGTELVEIFSKAKETKQVEQSEDSDKPKKGKGNPKNRLTKRDIYNAKFNSLADSERESQTTSMLNNIIAVLEDQKLDPFTLKQLHDISVKAFDKMD
ncbi:MAG: hypothetical protein KME47_09720 [Nodosilinea sp. WJT8-NPBG4]|jgi:hypothetical protein|nr:hypothetical protein [Nodosilinea sp. WJT8-NPBG4]